MFNASSAVALCILVLLPAAFRIWIVALPTRPSPDEASDTLDEQEPVYSIIIPLRGEARVVDQLLSAIERLNYPREKLDVIIAVGTDRSFARQRIRPAQPWGGTRSESAGKGDAVRIASPRKARQAAAPLIDQIHEKLSLPAARVALVGLGGGG